MRALKRLKHERRVRRVSQQGVEQITGVNQSVISLAESGRLVPTPQQLQALADFFGVPADDLLADVVVLEPRR